MNYEKIGKFICLRRKEMGLTQKQLASELHVTDKAISKWETGQGCPDVSILGELSESLDVGIGEILNGEYDSNLKDNNRFILDAVTYSKETTTKKIYKKISYILVVIMSVLCCYMIGMEIYQSIWHSKKYEYKVNYLDKMEDYQKIYDEVVSKMNVVENWKTNKFTDDKIKMMNNYIIGIKQNLDVLKSYITTDSIWLDVNEFKRVYVFSQNLLVSPVAFYYDLPLEEVKELNILQKTITTLVLDNSDIYYNDYSYYKNGNWYYRGSYFYQAMSQKIETSAISSYIRNGLDMLNLALDKVIRVGEYYE